MPKAVLGQSGLEKLVFRDFSPVGVRRPKRKMQKKRCRMSKRNSLGGRIPPPPPPKVPLAPGNCVFVFYARARNFTKCQRPWAKTPLNRYFRPVGVRPGKKKCPQESCENPFPDGVGAFFPISGPLALENCVFVFPPGPGVSLSAKGPKEAATESLVVPQCNTPGPHPRPHPPLPVGGGGGGGGVTAV